MIVRHQKLIRKIRQSPLVQAVLSRALGISVQTKILGLAIGLVVVLSTMIVWQMSGILTSNLRDQLDKQAISIGSDVAARASNELLINNTYAVYELIQNTLHNNEDILYIFVVDNQGNVLAHTFGAGFPKDLLKVNTLTGDEKYHLIVFRSEEGIVRDVAVPILDGKLGVARVGMGEHGLQKAVLQMTWKLLLITVFVSGLGIVAAVLLTRVLTQQIRELVSLTERVAQGELDVEGVEHSHDEFGQLMRAFNQMTKNLSQNYREREELLAQLKEKEEMRLKLLAKVITAQEEERKRISRELHDETSQALTSMMVSLKLLESEAAYCAVSDRLNEMRGTVAQTLEEVHRLARELRPSVLDDIGLVAALERYIKDYKITYGIEVDFHAGGFQGRRVPPPLEVALYRIIQEALTNAAKYARTATASVLLDWRDDCVSAIVEDNGIGISLEGVQIQSGQGLGIFGMQERAALLGGTFKIESQPAVGTTIYVKIPVPPGPAPAQISL